jgi:hypothetical protein
VAAGLSVDPARWREQFDELMGRIAGRFARVEPRRRARAFVLGLLSGLRRKNCWTIAEQAGDDTPDGMQHLLAAARWDADAVRDDVRGYVVEHLGSAGAVLVVDETGDVKKGRASAGVQRQYSGTAGRVENCQVAVFLSYATPAGHALIDRELYLPRSWAAARGRCAAAGVPEGTVFATKPKLARAMIARALDAGTPAAWVTGDEVYGGDRACAPVPGITDVGHLAGRGLQRGEQRRGAVPDVVMAALFGDPGPQRQHRGGAFQGLGLGLLIDAQHHGLVGRVEIQAGDVTDFGFQLRAGGELETSPPATAAAPTPATPWRPSHSTIPARRPAAGTASASLPAAAAAAPKWPAPPPHHRLSAACPAWAGPPARRPPPAAYRRFQETTVGLDTPVRRTISLVPSPSAASSTILARCASPARIDGERAHEASTSRSRGGTSTLTVNAISHRPRTTTRGQEISLTRH